MVPRPLEFSDVRGPAFASQKVAQAPEATSREKEGHILASPLPVAQTLALAASLPNRRFKIPDNVYGGAAIIGVLKNWHEESFDDWLQFCGEAWIRLLLSHIVQIVSMVGLWQLTEWQHFDLDAEECYEIEVWLFAVCLWMFFMSIMTEIIAAMDMVELILLQVPTVSDVKDSVLLYAEDEAGELKRQSGGMTVSRKVFIFLAVLLPRVVIGITLLIIGGLFLASTTTNTDMFLNSLAAAFVIEIDEMVFNFLTPAASKRLIEEIPPFDVPEFGGAYEKGQEPSALVIWRSMHRFWGMFKIVTSLVLVYIFYVTSKKCPNDPCAEFGCIITWFK